jgi:hypothetical protein
VRDAGDERLHKLLAEEIPGIVMVVVGPHLSLSLEKLLMTGQSPRLVIVSGRLYPAERPELVSLVRRVVPAAEFLVVSAADDEPPVLHQLGLDRVRHLVISPAAAERSDNASRRQLGRAAYNLTAGTPWSAADYLKRGTTVREFPLSRSDEKEAIITSIVALIDGDGPDAELFRQKVALLADEMLENSLYAAPRTPEGTQLYRKGEQRPVTQEEQIVFRFGFDGETVAMEAADGWGSLRPETVIQHLAKNQSFAGDVGETGGRGIFIIWRFLEQLHISICPGRRTVVGGHVRRSSPIDPEAPKGFHIVTSPSCI